MLSRLPRRTVGDLRPSFPPMGGVLSEQHRAEGNDRGEERHDRQLRRTRVQHHRPELGRCRLGVETHRRLGVDARWEHAGGQWMSDGGIGLAFDSDIPTGALDEFSAWRGFATWHQSARH